MNQLSREELAEVKPGILSCFVKLFLIGEVGEPKIQLGRNWPVMVEKVGDDLTFTLSSLTWPGYSLNKDCSEGGDFVYEDYLMQVFKK